MRYTYIVFLDTDSFRHGAHGGGRVVSASGSETSVSSSMPTSAIIYDAYTSIIKIKKKFKKKKVSVTEF